jgi:hypothetical protein
MFRKHRVFETLYFKILDVMDIVQTDSLAVRLEIFTAVTMKNAVF